MNVFISYRKCDVILRSMLGGSNNTLSQHVKNCVSLHPLVQFQLMRPIGAWYL